MKALSLLLVVAGCLAFYIAKRTPAPSYEPPAVEELVAGPTVPRFLSRAAADGERLCVLEVEGMCCAGCTSKVHAAVVAVEGVQEAAVDFSSRSVRALVRDGLDLTLLEEALAFDKYRATLRP